MATTTAATPNQSKDRQQKRVRPPDLALDPKKIVTNISVQVDPPSTQANSPSSISNSPIDGIPGYDDTEDELGKDLAVLEKLRQNVHKNLRLRPLNSSSAIQNRSPHSPTLRGTPLHTAPAWFDTSRPLPNEFVASPTSATSSIYYTPTSDTPMSAYFGVPGPTAASGLFSPPPAFHTSTPKPGAIQYHSLHLLVMESPRPLLIDTRPLNTFFLSHLRHSINLAIPSLILKRSRKPGAGFQSIDALRQYITTDRGKKFWDDTMNNGDWDGNVVVYDEDMDEKYRNTMQTTAWALLPVLRQIVPHGTVQYLQGGLSSARADPSTQNLFISGDSDTPLEQRQFKSKKGGGLSQLDTLAASRSKQLPQIEYDTPQSPLPPVPVAAPVSSPAPAFTPPVILSPSRSWTTNSITIDTGSPSPPPRQVTKRPSVPSLRKIDTQSIERQPKLSLKTQFSKSATHLTGPAKPWNISRPTPLNIPPPSPSPSHFNLSFSNLPFGSSSTTTTGPPHLNIDRSTTPNGLLSVTPTHSRPGTPRTPTTPLPPSPMTARQEDIDPPTTEEAFPAFAVSTILPTFLFLGPELTTEDHVQELLALGVKRILNIAAECDDDQGLRLRKRFGYTKIPMRDFVEEENIRKGIRNVCDILDDARLHSSPTYIHCKAGKSRSVTAVIGYLIHANHWTLSRAYSFVLERRKGISPNIGFVSELMNFEEEELGGKSVGVVKVDGEQGENCTHAVGVGTGRRPTNVRESLPPTFNGHSYSFGGVEDANGVYPDSGQDMEVRDASGRYRHARRAPVNETTLQPTRRVSKAGLESGLGEMEQD
ncbi:hypothetical protein BJ322DRAFT_1066049 [Thelephora terrestris]|uniref:protein-tyrosine-phosphatase n=1 Tax=Thelephora terrestris TaxID=56493 RepID=A0A9P6HDH4_9AGAM|nr:hypothetical protein BJ322DRAFT_1066049 [Thelephora terrestris]